jgi:hypothetical protein
MWKAAQLLATMTAVAVVATIAALAQSPTPTALTQAVAATQAARVQYAFDYDLETSKQNWRARFEPGADPALRLVQPRREDLDGSERRAFDRMASEMEGVTWCASENMGRVSNLTLLREDEASATYAFQPTAESVRGEQARRFVDRLRGEVTVVKDEPDVSRIRLYTPQSFSPVPLVRIERMQVAIACRPAPNGRRYAAEVVTDVQGSAFGTTFEERSVQRAHNLH